MPVEDNYEPSYIDLDDVPISGPDEYDSQQKRLAIFHAESSLELDVNSGKPIASDNVVGAHKAAVMNLATHVLTHAAEDPSNTTIGDMADDGGTITEYSSRYLDEYERLVDKLIESGVGSGDGGSGYGNFAITVNSGEDYDPDEYTYEHETGDEDFDSTGIL